MICEWCEQAYEVSPCFVGKTRFCSMSCLGSHSVRMQGGRRSSIEIAIEAVLEALGVEYEAQHRIGKWLCDFYIPSARLVIECDGSYWHSLPKNAERDTRKDRYLKKRGYEVVRLREKDINEDPLKALLLGAGQYLPLSD